jgi:hypothetical protein
MGTHAAHGKHNIAGQIRNTNLSVLPNFDTKGSARALKSCIHLPAKVLCHSLSSISLILLDCLLTLKLLISHPFISSLGSSKGSVLAVLPLLFSSQVWHECTA